MQSESNDPQSAVPDPQVAQLQEELRRGIEQAIQQRLPPVINRHLHQWRPATWEDDLSKNALDNAAFDNGMPISEYPREAILKRIHMLDAALGADHGLNEASIFEMVQKDHYPIPHADDREGYMRGNDVSYWLSGLVDFLKVMRVIDRQQLKCRAMLDLGCASGRVVRHFCVQTECPTVWGTDINGRHVRWLSEFMPETLRPVFTSCLPTLPIADSSLDLVCAFSVFTHIDTFETAWLAELLRVLRPGGICYVTVHNENTWIALRELDETNRLIKSMLVSEHFDLPLLQGEMPGERLVYRFIDRGPYRSQVFHSDRYLQKTWGRFFEILEILPRHHNRQTVVVMRKRPDA